MLLEQCDRDAVMSKVENSRVHLVRGTIDDHLVSLRNASRSRIFAGSGQLQSARTLIPGVPDRQRQKSVALLIEWPRRTDLAAAEGETEQSPMRHHVEGPLWVANLSTAAHLRECPESALSCRCSRHRQAASVARGRVKRRSPTIIEQFTVAARAMAWRIFRIPYPKSNRIACFRKGGDFSHGCAGRPARS